MCVPQKDDWEPEVGQQVDISGTGAWWAGQRFHVTIVDVRESDESIKVQYPDGGFKRFTADKFRSLMDSDRRHVPVGSEGWTPVAGQHVYLAGTSKWWAGPHFGAVILDVRESDQTVKVRYTDGGFKRFSASVFRTLVVDRPAAPEMWEEWQTAMPAEPASEVKGLHEELLRAVQRQDFLGAAALQARFRELAAREEGGGALHARLLEAAHRGQYLEAHRLKQQIEEATRGAAGPTGPEAPSAARFDEALERSARRALSGGVAGASAMVLQVSCFFWLRTTMNFQYRFGTSTGKALRTLYADGGLRRFYRGISPALLQGPLARFADTAANAGVMALFEEMEAQSWPAWARTFFASSSAVAMRIFLLPLDTVKTIMQVHGKDGLLTLASKYRSGGAPIFFHGAAALSAANFLAHYPWYTVFNTLDERVPNYQERHKELLRNASIGFCASVCSDTVSNCLRVVKTCRQTNETLTYAGIVKNVIREDGMIGLFGRGLKTRIIANGGQGVVFSVTYKLFEEHLAKG